MCSGMHYEENMIKTIALLFTSLALTEDKEEMGVVLLPWHRGIRTGRRSTSHPLPITTGKERHSESTKGECTECCRSNSDSCR